MIARYIKFPLYYYYYYCHVSEQLGQSHQMNVEYPGVKDTTRWLQVCNSKHNEWTTTKRTENYAQSKIAKTNR